MESHSINYYEFVEFDSINLHFGCFQEPFKMKPICSTHT